jgi:DNA modification methylase
VKRHVFGTRTGHNRSKILRKMKFIQKSEEYARFFYAAKASKKDRDEGCEELPMKKYTVSVVQTAGVGLHGENMNGHQVSVAKNHHPTVKPTNLMQYLVRLVTRKGGVVLDPFCGSGSTGKACAYEGMQFIGIERETEYVEIAKARIEYAQKRVSQTPKNEIAFDFSCTNH